MTVVCLSIIHLLKHPLACFFLLAGNAIMREVVVVEVLRGRRLVALPLTGRALGISTASGTRATKKSSIYRSLSFTLSSATCACVCVCARARTYVFCMFICACACVCSYLNVCIPMHPRLQHATVIVCACVCVHSLPRTLY
jgi:hypothetical protein